MNTMTDTMHNEAGRHWYRQPMMWMIVLLLVGTVIACIGLYYIAAKTDDGLVSEHYYEDGQAISKEIALDTRARALGLSAQVMIGDDGQHIRVILQPTTIQPASLALKFTHPTLPGGDQLVTLASEGGGAYQGALPARLLSQRWLVQLSADDWRLQTEAPASSGGVLALQPMPAAH